jgi:hypothetical protein
MDFIDLIYGRDSCEHGNEPAEFSKILGSS